MFTLPKLPYDYNALEDYIDEKTMTIHHDMHHAGYVKKLNAALEGHDDYLDMEISELLMKINEIPEEKRQAVINNGGGHANHRLFWEIMSPNGGTIEGEIADAINEKFGSFESFKEEFGKAASTRFGSGWAWLIVRDGELEVMSTANQDSPIMEGKTPVLGLDVWEHAYYLNYQNRRPEYIENWWNVVNWSKVNELYQNAK